MTVTRREVYGLGAVAAIAIAAWWVVGRGPDPAPDSSVRPAAAGGGSAQVPAADVPVVAMAALAAPRPEPADTGRDLFRFGGGDSRRGADSGPGSRLALPLPSPAARPADAGVVVPQGPPPLPPIPLKFIGVVRREGTHPRIAVLSDANGVYHGKEGDIIEGRYRVGRVSDDSVELSYVDGRGRMVVRLSGS